jgi:23S rRNA (uridine2552-2'-O)-methyltransferase
VKTFQGDLFDGFVKEVKQLFSVVKIVKPRASRSESAEVYVLGLKLRSIPFKHI